MKRVFTTVMADQAGAFLGADRCITDLGLNITRVSYNKAVDAHMLFVEVEGDEAALGLAETALAKLGYLPNTMQLGSVILMEFRLKDRPGALLPVLELIRQFDFNISYISAQENGTGYQNFKMGLFVESSEDVSDFMRRAARLCPVRVLDYDRSEKVLDNTVFYLSFVTEISEKMGLSDEAKSRLLVDSNLIMQMLDERDRPVHQVFDCISQFADCIRAGRGAGYQPRVTRLQTCAGLPITLIEPPCGSNLCLLECRDMLLGVDSGFACYREELLRTILGVYPDFRERRRELLLTHGDVDHCGCLDLFQRVYMNQKVWDNFELERRGAPNFREENAIHAPYARISKLLTDYRPPSPDNLTVFAGTSEPAPELLTPIGRLELAPLCFEVYEGQGGHVLGEMVYVERTHRIAFTGDIFVNVKAFLPAQAKFNRLAPFLMTSVDVEPALAKREREALFGLLDPGKWQIFGAHGGVCEVEIS